MSFESGSSESKKQEGRATIGPSVSVKGEISGDEDILIEGAVEGQISLKKNSVTVAKGGRVKANVMGVTVRVEGEVVGDVTATEKVIVVSSGRVIGNISAAKISLEEGSRVKGMIDTDSGSDSGKLAARVEESVTAEGAKKPSFFGLGKDGNVREGTKTQGGF